MKSLENKALFPALPGCEVQEPVTPDRQTLQVRKGVLELAERVPVPAGTSALRAGLRHLHQAPVPLEGDAWYVIEVVA